MTKFYLIEMGIEELRHLLFEIVQLPKESEWVEFKVNNADPQEIGKNISALSNSACLHKQSCAYLVWGVEDATHKLVGTKFVFTTAKKGSEELEHWIAQRLSPRIDFKVREFILENKQFVIVEIPATTSYPVTFMKAAYIRIGGITRELHEFPEKEKKIWLNCAGVKFEDEFAIKDISAGDVINLLNCQGFFELLKIPFPSDRDGVLQKLLLFGLIKHERGVYHITNLGAISLAKNLTQFGTLTKKAPRVIVYEGKDKLKIKRQQDGVMGYAVGFAGLIAYINSHLPSNEEISGAFRETVKVYPEVAIRELIANALIHQDFNESEVPLLIEIFSDRIEITNPGKPIIKTNRFIDENKSRNENLSSLMRKLRICEHLGSGIDKVIDAIEFFQLPAPDFQETDTHTKVIVFSPQKYKDMEKGDRIRACYQHCGLKYIKSDKMTNTSLRTRFKIDIRNSSMVSTIINQTLKEGLIKYDDPANNSRKFAKYVPYWA